ncbi:methyltransferase domain-containing protein [Mucilaginibacter sp. HMF7410]|uniref:Methyltransferase domain-containing protein n=2 Tax=Mucilaginibacter arboris TaxID=2682090 RepID=A0A7K1SST0_9SPHI|nr:methyltransferase domain-containing protein [Mucilaginibacter arboris]
MDIYGQALLDFYNRQPEEKLWLHNTYGGPEEMPIEVFFRGEEEMPEAELLALQLCRGKVLDIGAGAGSHALILQQQGFDVAALEISAGATAVMQKRGVKRVVQQDIYQYKTEKFDTLLLLMNGIGLTQTLAGLGRFLHHTKQLLLPGGQLIFDSSDIAYLYEDVPLPKNSYYGEISYQYQYKNQKSDWFNWLYIDQKTLLKTALKNGWNCEVLYEDEMDLYLARLTLA